MPPMTIQYQGTIAGPLARDAIDGGGGLRMTVRYSIQPRSHPWRRALLAGLALIAVAGGAAAAEAPVDYTELSLGDLMQTDIVYGASKFEQEAKDAPSSVTIVTAREIKGFGYRSLAEVLASVRGFYATYDRNYEYLGARGFGRPGDYNSRVLVLIDGVRLNENIYDSTTPGLAFPLDLDLVQRIEIIRGPSSSLYGTSAVFAIVNIITKSAHEYDGVQLTGHVGSFGTLGGQIAAGRYAEDGLSVLVSASTGRVQGQDHYYAEFDDPLTGNGVAEDCDEAVWRRRLFGRVDRGPLHLEALWSSPRKHVPTAPWGTIFNDSRTWTEDQVGYVAAWYDGDVAEGTRLLTRVTYGGYDYNGSWIYDYADEGDPPAPVVNRDNGIGRWLDAEFRADPAGGRRSPAGLRRRVPPQLQAGPGRVGRGPLLAVHRRPPRLAERRRLRAGRGAHERPRPAQPRHPARRVLHLRRVHEPQAGPGRDRARDRHRGQAHLRLRLPRPQRLRALLRRRRQRAEGQPGPAARNHPHGRDRAGPGAGLATHGSLSLFRYENRDLIELVEDPADGFLVFRNESEVEALGAEVEVRHQAGTLFTTTASYGYQDARYTGSDLHLTNSPRHMAKFNLLKQVFAAPTTLGLEVLYFSERQTQHDGHAAGFLLTNLTLVHAPLNAPYELSLGLRNLFDTDIRHPGGLELRQDAIRQDGRALRLTLVVRP